MGNIEYIIPVVFIVIIFFISLFKIKSINTKRLKEYESNINNLILDDYINSIRYEKVPGILMSIGIIGTFVLIYFGLNSIPNGLDISKVLEVIKEQIAPAFLVSAFGILMSIAYVFIESLILKSNKTAFEIYKNNDKSLTYVNVATQELQTSKNILTAITKQTETFHSLSSFADGLENVTASMELFSEVAEKIEKTLNPDKLGEVISSALSKKMTPVLLNIQAITSNVDENSQKITRFLEDDLKNEIIKPLKDAVVSTDKSMQEMREVLKSTSDVMNQTSQGIEKISVNLSKLEKSQTDFVLNLDKVLDKQKNEFENTTKIIEGTYTKLNSTVKEQTDEFKENSKIILKSFTGLSIDMKGFLEEYKEDYKVILAEQQKAIIETKDSAVEILDKSGEKASELISNASNILDKTLSEVNTTLVNTSEKAGKILEQSGQGVADVITMASNNLNSTLSGVDEALVKTSQSIKEELENFKNSYTDSLKGFLDSQEEILNKVFKEQTERLAGVVDSFRSNLEMDVENRKVLNDELDKLIKQTDGFVSSTKAMIATGFDEQQSKLTEFLKINQTMQSKLSNIINDASDINENGNLLTKDLIETTANLQKQFNDNQTEVLKRYQTNIDEHLKDILNYMAAIIEASHIDNDK